MRFDGPTFARAWLAVSQAAATDPESWRLYRAVSIETYDEGVRLMSLDGRILLTAWVPDLDHTSNEDGDAAPPSPDLLPARQVTVRDLDHRGRGLLAYTIKLLSGFEKDIRGRVGLVQLDLDLDARDVDTDGDDTMLDGMGDQYAALVLPDAERVLLPKLGEAFPDWRPLVAGHHGRPARHMLLNSELVARLAAANRYAPGHLALTFAGDTGGVLAGYDCARPVLSGLVMPIKPITDDPPAVDLDDAQAALVDDPTDDPDDDPDPPA